MENKNAQITIFQETLMPDKQVCLLLYTRTSLINRLACLFFSRNKFYPTI